ncbi:helix-turn-helix domain-containing protein [Streptacidiphilus melanogenes]|uniref:helix-turn-helix domain-containing protein n=1 Tax=Streptacidiphilus melanogenes TaxID=411235 RepID=UPI0005A71889|nr:helix-turn-helix domain-containing protein [Streptacidiphilus melanogenes]
MTTGTTSTGSTEPLANEPSIGQVLGNARVAAGLTVDEVSAETRVRVPIVHGIEADDFSRCGGDFYARGHVRALARAVGVDGDELVCRYDAAHGGAPQDAKVPLLENVGERRISAERRRPNWTAAMVAAIVVVIAVIGFNLAQSGPKATTASAGSPSSAASGATPSIGPVLHPTLPPASSAPVKPSAIAAAPAGKVTVKLLAQNGDSWMMVKDGTGKVIFEGDLAQGQTQTFTDAKELKFVLGNAGGVHVWANGKDLGTAGGDGQVVNVTYTPGDPVAG